MKTVWNARIVGSGQRIMRSVLPAIVLIAWIVTGSAITVTNRYVILAGACVRPVIQLCVRGVWILVVLCARARGAGIVQRCAVMHVVTRCARAVQRAVGAVVPRIVNLAQ